MKVYSLIEISPRDRFGLAVAWLLCPLRLIGWLTGVCLGSLLAGFLQGWEDVR